MSSCQRLTRLILAWSTSAVLMVSCSSSTTTPEVVVGDWILDAIVVDGEDMPIVLADLYDKIRMSVNADGTLSGNFACNAFQGEYVFSDNEFVIKQGMTNAANCIEDEIMRIDRIMNRTLGSEQTVTAISPELGTMTWTLENTALLWSRS